MHSLPKMKPKQLFLHWVLRSKYGYQPLKDREACVELWKILQMLFPKPQTLAAVLMHNHAHWITTHRDDVYRLKYKLKRKLISFEKKWRCQFEEQPVPTIIPDQHHLQRNIRYVHLNPCRANLVSDPLLWEWSTHWDYLGLIHDPWVDRKYASQSINRTFSVEEFHRYVSSDPKTSLTGTPPITLSQQKRSLGVEDMLAALLFIERASAQSLRKKQQLRSLAVETARIFEIPLNKLSPLLGISPQAAYQLKHKDQSIIPIEKISALNQDIRSLQIIRNMRILHKTRDSVD